VLLWQANQAMFDALLLVGLLVMPVGVILFGLAMRQDLAFGKIAGNVSVALGVVGLAAATLMLVDPLSPVAALGIFALIGFHLVAGWKTYRLSTTA
jgi:vacuolar-type H+-ATPase subunit I/STV1